MGKKSRRPRNSVPCFAFTKDSFKLLERALDLFEQPLRAADYSDEKVALAHKTLLDIREKLKGIQRLPAIALPFNHNEIVVITHALIMYDFKLVEAPFSLTQVQELLQCRLMTQHFTRLHMSAR